MPYPTFSYLTLPSLLFHLLLPLSCNTWWMRASVCSLSWVLASSSSSSIQIRYVRSWSWFRIFNFFSQTLVSRYPCRLQSNLLLVCEKKKIPWQDKASRHLCPTFTSRPNREHVSFLTFILHLLEMGQNALVEDLTLKVIVELTKGGRSEQKSW